MANPRHHALLNRWLDDLQARWRGRGRYRRQLLERIAASHAGWPHADYGAGYLYQSMPALGLRGFRHTDARARAMGLAPALAGRTVLEIGCNTGFLSLTLAPGTRRYAAFDNNPYLIDIARLSASELGEHGVEFQVATIEQWPTSMRFDVVLSFANHSTWDGNLGLSTSDYFAELHALLVPGGTMFFESHHPALEDESALARSLACMAPYFALGERRVLNAGSAWDRGRSFIEARARLVPEPATA